MYVEVHVHVEGPIDVCLNFLLGLKPVFQNEILFSSKSSYFENFFLFDAVRFKIHFSFLFILFGASIRVALLLKERFI